MTWHDYYLAYQGYWLRHNRLLEANRLTAHTLVSINTKKGQRVKSPSAIWPLLTDKVEPVKINIPSQEEMEQIKKRYFGNGK